MVITKKRLTIRENKLLINNKQTKNKFLTQAILKVKVRTVPKKENLTLFLKI